MSETVPNDECANVRFPPISAASALVADVDSLRILAQTEVKGVKRLLRKPATRQTMIVRAESECALLNAMRRFAGDSWGVASELRLAGDTETKGRNIVDRLEREYSSL